MRIKIRTILLIFVMLIMGIIIGSQNSVGTNNYFEETKDEFEQEIINPNNTYEPKKTVVEGNALSKAAVKIDDLINTIINKVLEKIA
jgi:hypothetical protein